MRVRDQVGGELDARCGHSNCEGQGEYRMRGACGNCGWTGIVRITCGHQAPTRAECPRCKCKTVRCNEWAGL